MARANDDAPSCEEMVRQIMKAIRTDRELFDDFCSGRDPADFSAGDLITPANCLSELLKYGRQIGG